MVSRDAPEYAPLLEKATQGKSHLDFANSTEAALECYNKHSILLAQPDMGAAIIDRMPTVKWVQSTWAGVTPLLHTQRQDYMITGVKNVFGPQMAEYTLGQILAYEQRLLARQLKQLSRTWWERPSGRLQGKTLGIMGTGSIGGYIARTARALGLDVVGFSYSGKPLKDFNRVYALPGLHDFLGQSDYVVAVLPDTPQTTGLMNAERFAAMQAHALFINIGRGNLVDEDALMAALEAGQIAAAALDVFRSEPLPNDSPLWSIPNLTITGHIAARSWPEDITGIFLENLERYQAGVPLNYQVERKRGY